MSETETYRVERDPLGEKKVPAAALYGVQTARALENFRISPLRISPLFIRTYAEIKKAAAEANMETGELEPEFGAVIVQAADEIIEGRRAGEFDLDVFQAGAGTSYNMNLNEVIANRALELLGRERGDHEYLNPNDHVNKSQSTNDTMPTAIRITAVRLARDLCEELDDLASAFEKQGREFAGHPKSARTHLHDAVPITLGQEMDAYAANIRRGSDRVRETETLLLEVPLGGTAVGTGLNARPGYSKIAIEKLSEITGLDLREAENKIASQQSLGDFVTLSAAVRNLCIELSKIANDLRLLNSGPHTGLYEIELPAKQPGSSIMPGKVNPAMAEMLNMVCFHVIGADHAIASCAEAGQLELNVMMPYVAYALFANLEILARAARTFNKECVSEIKAHRERGLYYEEQSVGQAAKLNGELGFMGAAEIAIQAVDEEKTVREVLIEKDMDADKLLGPQSS